MTGIASRRGQSGADVITDCLPQLLVGVIQKLTTGSVIWRGQWDRVELIIQFRSLKTASGIEAANQGIQELVDFEVRVNFHKNQAESAPKYCGRLRSSR